MTAFSYAVSHSKDEDFKEPELLNLFIERLHDDIERKNNKAVGWILHYSMGGLWTCVYALLRNKLVTKPSLLRDLAFGVVSGVLGTLIWKWLFRRHPHPPHVRHKQFYVHLFIAHIIFALSVGKTYSVLEGRKESTLPFKEKSATNILF